MPPVLLRLLLVVAIVAIVGGLGAAFQSRDGRLRPGRRSRRWTGRRTARSKPATAGDAGAGRFDEDQLQAVGLAASGEVSALLLSSPTCAPCRAVKRVLAEVTEARPSFTWVSVDAADYLDIAREHRVMRVPTLFLLDDDGWILARTSGVPATHDLIRVVDRDTDHLG